MQINVTYGQRRLQVKVPAYVLVPDDPNGMMRVLLNESYFSGQGLEPMPDEMARLEILGNIAIHLGAMQFLRDDLLALLSDEARQQLASKIPELDDDIAF